MAEIPQFNIPAQERKRMNKIATIGDNGGPALDPLPAMSLHIDTLMETAQGFLDGEPVETAEAASIVAKLIDEGRKAGKDADTLRKEEAKPFDEGKRAVQARWKPVIDKTDLIVATAKRALIPYQVKLEAEQRAAAERARKEAEASRQAQIEAERAARESADLEAAQRADELRKAADKAQREASKADKATAAVAVEGARAISLRTVWRAEITDRRALLQHYMRTRPDDLEAWLQMQADRDVHAGIRAIPGVLVRDEKVAA
jgi:hypothetical protein